MHTQQKAKLVLGIIALALSPEARAAACGDRDFVTIDRPVVNVAIQGRSYTPRCLRVKAGTRVTIAASDVHPLQGVRAAGGPANPFVQPQEATAPQTRTLGSPGLYPYFCTHHGDANGGGMAGAILAE